jgi:hypothetical protein
VRLSLARLRGGAGGAEGRLLEEVARGGVRFEEVVVTRNRRVLISVGERGRVLRIHESFLAAPPEVLRAVGTLLGRGRRGRAGARKVIRAFVSDVPTAPPVRRRRHIPPADAVHLDLLGAEFDRVNDTFFAGELPRVPLYLSGRMRRRNGHFSADPLEIVISRRLCEHAEDGEAASTLRHEMIHLWQHAQGLKPGHGPDFRAWARRLDVHPRAVREVLWNGEE